MKGPVVESCVTLVIDTPCQMGQGVASMKSANSEINQLVTRVLPSAGLVRPDGQTCSGSKRSSD